MSEYNYSREHLAQVVEAQVDAANIELTDSRGLMDVVVIFRTMTDGEFNRILNRAYIKGTMNANSIPDGE